LVHRPIHGVAYGPKTTPTSSTNVGGFNDVVRACSHSACFVVARFVMYRCSNKICSEILMIKQTTFSIILDNTCYHIMVSHGLTNDSAAYIFT